MILILGSGVAGLACALAVAEAGGHAAIVTPGALSAVESAGAVRGIDAVLAGGNTAMAQGGIAAAVGPDDTAALHAGDTVAAGVGLVDAEAAAVLTAEGAAAVRALISAGFPADRTADGALALGLEAAHSRSRIVHAGEDHTGAVLHEYLTARVLGFVGAEHIGAGRIELIERTTAVSLLNDSGAVAGAVLRDADGRLSAVRSEAVVVATGGYAGLFQRTSGHPGARGEGVVLAARAGALLADLEFVQFHPTALVGTGFLVSEAVRGAGAVLRDGSGERFMASVHPAAELAPRDVVSRTMHRLMRARGEDSVWLDATGIEREGGAGTLARRFPSITAATRAQGYDWSREPIPVAPAAHYAMGGIATDLDGRSTVPGLFAAGEAASTGVHGANRLASNSLLEGLAFGGRAGRAAVSFAAAATAGAPAWELHGDGMRELVAGARDLPARSPEIGEVRSDELERDADAGSRIGRDSGLDADPGLDTDPVSVAARDDATVRAAAEAGLGIERDAEGLRAVIELCARTPGSLAELAGLVAVAAEARTESRGAHQRSDAPSTDEAQARRRAWAPPPAPRTSPVPTLEQGSLSAC